MEPASGGLRLTIVNKPPGRILAVIAASIVAAVTIAACGVRAPASPQAAVPSEFRAACGHPGAQVMASKVPETISHAECDLTGVMISYRNYSGAAVPRGHGGTTISNSSGFTLTVHPGTLDVTVNATGIPGNE